MSKDTAMAALTGNPVPAAAPTVAPTTQNAPTTPLPSTPFSQIAKKEAEIVRQRQELKRDQELNNSEKAKLADIKKQYDEYQVTKQKDPVAALKILGFSESDIFNYMAQSQPEELSLEQKASKAAETAADAKIKEFERSQAQREADNQRKSDQGLIQNYRQEVSRTLAANQDKYEYCNHYGPAAEQLIYETVLAVVKESKGTDVVSPAEAAAMVEEYYEEQDKLMSGLKKRQPKPAQPQAANTDRTSKVTPGFPSEPQPKPVITKTRTLHQGATATMASSRQVRNESKGEKRERLIEALRNGAKP